MKNGKIRKMTLCAMFTALTCLATMIAIPVAGIGYVNAGDCLVILSAWFLGSWYSAFSAAVGSSLSDLFLGYGIYAPATFIIKGVMAVVFCMLYKNIQKISEKPLLNFAFCAVVTEIVMVAGYFLHACIILGEGWGASATIFANSMQGIFGVISSAVLSGFLKKLK